MDDALPSLVQARLDPLPAASPDFPVQPTHRVAPDLAKQAQARPQIDADYPSVLAAKCKALQARPDAFWCASRHWPRGHWRTLWDALGLARAHWVQALSLQMLDDTVDRGVLEGQPALQALLARLPAQALALTLALQEDWVLMSRQGRFEAGSVCMPSGWVPAEKFGQSLVQIHAPVADGQALRKASPALVQAMTDKGPFVRHVWTLCRNTSLARHPHWPEDTRPESDEALYFRSERQTTWPVPSLQAGLFLIRVQVRPLSDLLSGEQGAGRLRLLQQALASMSDAVIAYKQLGQIRQQVMAMHPPQA